MSYYVNKLFEIEIWLIWIEFRVQMFSELSPSPQLLGKRFCSTNVFWKWHQM